MVSSVTVYVLVLCLVQISHALVNVAADRPYYVTPEGFTEMVFRSYDNQPFEHVLIYEGLSTLLTLSLPVSSPSLLWTNSTEFNVTVIIDLGSHALIKETLIMGPCCNLGIFTPIAGYVFGSNSLAGPWTLIAKSQGLESGDSIDTPAVKYEMHMMADEPNADSWLYVQLIFTGAANTYMGIRNIKVYA